MAQFNVGARQQKEIIDQFEAEYRLLGGECASRGGNTQRTSATHEGKMPATYRT